MASGEIPEREINHTGIRVNVYLNRDDYELGKKEARLLNRSFSAWIRRLIKREVRGGGFLNE